MSAGDMSVSSCDGFPPFIRLTGKFYGESQAPTVAGRFMYFNALFSEPSVGFFYPIPFHRRMRSINGPTILFTRNGVPDGGELPPWTESDAAVHGFLLRSSLTYFQVMPPGADGVSRQFGGYEVDPCVGELPVRQSGWTGGVYTHTVGQIARRRTGPQLSDCTYWRCIKNTNETYQLPTGVWTVGNKGDDPQSLPMYWSQDFVQDGLSVNTFIVGSFFDHYRNFVVGDWKFADSRGYFRVVKDVMMAAQSFDTFSNASIVENANRLAPSTPTPKWLQSAVVARYGPWTLGNEFGYLPETPQVGTLKRGWFVSDPHGYYRIQNDIAFPPPLAPSDDPNNFELMTNIPHFCDEDFPSRYSNGAVVNSLGVVTRRSFTRRLTYSKLTASTQFFSLFGVDGTSLSANALEIPRWGTAPVPVREYNDVFEIVCAGRSRLEPRETVTLLNHSCAAPDVSTVYGGSEVGRCRLYLWSRQVGSVGQPPPAGSVGSFEWLTDKPLFAKCGDYITIEEWEWTTPSNTLYVSRPTDGGLPPYPARHVANQFNHWATKRRYIGVPTWYPYHGSPAMAVWNIENFAWTIVGVGGVSAPWADPVVEDSIQYEASVEDIRSVDEVNGICYPNKKNGYGFFNDIANSNHSAQDSYYTFLNNAGRRTMWSWCNLHVLQVGIPARVYSGSTPSSDGNETAFNIKIDPMLMVRHKLRMQNPSTCYDGLL